MRVVVPSICSLLGLAFLTSTEAQKVVRASVEKISRHEVQSNEEPSGPYVNFLEKPQLEMRNHFDYVYLSTIKVGDNEKAFDVILDTGSSTFWLPHSALSKNHTHTYDCSQSKFCKAYEDNKQEIAYGEGHMKGYIVTDKVKFGDATIDDFKFLLATETDFKNHNSFDGIVGLSPINGKGDAPTVLRRMKDANIIEYMQLSMYLGSQTYSRGAATGEIIFGGYDTKYMSDSEGFKYVTAQKGSGHWTTRLTGVGMGTNTNISEGAIDVVVDSGTSLIFLPETFVVNILREAKKKGIKCGIDKKHELFGCDCKARTALDPLFIYFENLTLSIPSTSYIEQQDNKCFLTIKADTKGNFILGDVFLKNYYTLYDLDNYLIGFAPAAPVSHWKNWLLAGCIFGSMILIIVIIKLILRDKSATTTTGASNSTGGGVGSLFSRNQNQGVAVGGNSSNNPRSRLLDDQELH